MPLFPNCPRCRASLPPIAGGGEPWTNCPFCQADLQAAIPSAAILSDRRCQACGSLLTRPQAAAGSLCGQAACDQRQQAQAAAASERLRWKEHQFQERRALERTFQEDLVAEGHLTSAADSTVISVPSYQMELTPLPETRAEQFIQRIAKLAQRLFQEQATAEYMPVEGESHEGMPADPLHEQVIQAACTLCRGYCCSHGGEHAFLDIDSLRYRATKHGWRNEQELIEAYRTQLPAATHTDSCVFHTDRGCALPREMRSFTCNAFVCAGLDDWERTPPDQLVSEIGIVSQHNGVRQRQTVIRLAEPSAPRDQTL